jgi:hypothetical protein
MRNTSTITFGFALLAVAACYTTPEDSDGGQASESDAESAREDAGRKADAGGPAEDAGAKDAGPRDTGHPTDAGHPKDAGHADASQSDASDQSDGSDPTDVSDSGLDAGVKDAGPYDAGSCQGVPLAQRVKTASIDVSPEQAGGGWYQPTTVISPLSNGSYKVAWNSGDAVRVTAFDERDARQGSDLVFPASDIAGFVAHDDGGALLLVEGEAMSLVRFDAGGQETFRTKFTNNNPKDQAEATWIDWWSDAGRLGWSGTEYAAYFGHTKQWGSQGKHQGDMLQYIGPDGSPSGYGWAWGCSHSLDVRIAWNGTMWAPVCLSDCYPTKGIEFNWQGGEISAEPSGNCSGGSNAKLGGLAGTPDGFYLTFTSPEGRSSSDVAFSRIGNDRQIGPKVYLTDTASIQETGAKLARYGSDLLAAWIAGQSYVAAVVSTSGAVLDGPVALPVGRWNDHDDFINFANGDVGWAWAEGTALSVARLRLCR